MPLSILASITMLKQLGNYQIAIFQANAYESVIELASRLTFCIVKALESLDLDSLGRIIEMNVGATNKVLPQSDYLITRTIKTTFLERIASIVVC